MTPEEKKIKVIEKLLDGPKYAIDIYNERFKEILTPDEFKGISGMTGLLQDLAEKAYLQYPQNLQNKTTWGTLFITDKGRDYLKGKVLPPNFVCSTGSFTQQAQRKCSEIFINDINDLCKNCFIRDKVASVRATMIQKFEMLKSINSKEYIINHLYTEIDNDNKKIAEMINMENTGGPMYRENRVSVVLSYKDCIQYYYEQLKLVNEGVNTIHKVMPVDKVLIHEDYLNMIKELRNLHIETIDEYLIKKYEQHIDSNPHFAECLLKDISKIMEGVHKEGEGDLEIVNGDFVIEKGDFKVTGKTYIFDKTNIFLWQKVLGSYIINGGVLNIENLIRNYEKTMLNNNDYSPEIEEQIKILNLELKKENGIVQKELLVESITPPAPPRPEIIISKTETLKSELTKYGFYTLELVKDLPIKNTQKLIEYINSNELPYQIAMFTYLGFIEHLSKEHFTVKNKLYDGIAEILNKDTRSVKGNVLVLNPISKEKRERYTAHLHIETVKKEYLKIK